MTSLFITIFAVSVSSVTSFAATTDFISVWKTDNVSDGSTDGGTVRLPLVESGLYNFNVSWGDDSNSTVTAWDSASATHIYTSAGTYTITIDGDIKGWAFAGSGDRNKLLNVTQWGSLQLDNTRGAFQGAENFNPTAIDRPDLSGTNNLDYAFAGARNFNADISSWDVSHVVSLASTFEGASSFNKPLNSWDVSHVEVLRATFYDAAKFNQPLNDWDVSKVYHFGIAFAGASTFDQDLSSWDIKSGGQSANLTTQLDEFINGTWVSPRNYGKLLISWAAQTDPDSVSGLMWEKSPGVNAPNQFDTNARYTSNPQVLAARAALVSRGWQITDGGLIFSSGDSTSFTKTFRNTTDTGVTFERVYVGNRNAKDFTIDSTDCEGVEIP
ncbi:MAG: BspA family leucine-rich repeat surface protein, partial [Rhodoluna sp.]